ncbi:MAG: amidohydrolase family protein, partial [Candidatus Binatia bacterium]
EGARQRGARTGTRLSRRRRDRGARRMAEDDRRRRHEARSRASERIDEHWEKRAYRRSVPEMRRPASEYFRRQCFVSFEAEERMLPGHAAALGPETILWASDYPHPDGTFPGAVARVEAALAPLPEADRSLVLGANAARLYALPL